VIVGHEEAIARFAAAQQSGRLPQAWLIHGPRGIGKRRLSEHFAQRLLCAKQTACGECAECRQFQAGAHPDCVLTEREDDRRDLRIDLLRAAIERVTLASARSKRRVWIVDDACAMNPQAANALLKTLEEPPPGVFVLLVAHDLLRLPATIRSRCALLAVFPLSCSQCEAVLRTLGANEEDLPFLQTLADGRPGMVAAIAQDRQAIAALQRWQRWCAQPDEASIDQVRAWIREHALRLPHELIAKAAWLDWRRASFLWPQVAEALRAIARWPEEVRRHSLRPAYSLFVRWLALRAAVKETGG